MLAHPFIIALLISQISVAVIVTYAAWKGVYALRYWSATSFAAQQLTLERENYLLGAIVQVAVGTQIISLSLFIWLINSYLPDLIRGAMCGAGALEANMYGYPLLYVKTLTLPLYAFYLLLQFMDNRAPDYPLTPFKYYFMLPVVAAILVETWLMASYFFGLSPDVIVTCCSVDFLTSSSPAAAFLSSGSFLQPALWGWGMIGALLAAADWRKPFLPLWLHGTLTLIFIALSLYTLKYFFVKYIYGLPSHLCLFDLFLPHHYYVGYVLFSLYYILIISIITSIAIPIILKRIQVAPPSLQLWINLRLVALLLSLLIPLAYRVLWPHGTL